MTTLRQCIKRTLSLLQFAEHLGNVSDACNVIGYYRDTYYKVRRAFQTLG